MEEQTVSSPVEKRPVCPGLPLPQRRSRLQRTRDAPTSVRKTQPESPLQPDLGWALSPTEHAWMLSAVDGSYDTLLAFVRADPALLARRDLMSGYSGLHWLAKWGRAEEMAGLLRHAEGAGVRVDVDTRGSGGLTPLHVACMHGRFSVVKLLVGAFGADVHAMDNSGRRAWQYLRDEDTPAGMSELLGAWDHEQAVVSANKNCNSGGAEEDENMESVRGEQKEEGQSKDWASWRSRSFKKLVSSLSLTK